MLRNTGNIVSYWDAQKFRTRDNKKLRVKLINSSIYHYGWVRHPNKQLEKLNNFYSLWNGPNYTPPAVSEKEKFDFFKDADSVELFKKSHPEVMKKKLLKKTGSYNWIPTRKKCLSKKATVLF
jgi:hypothetical protein